MEPFSIAKRFQTSKNALEALKTLRFHLKLRKLFEKSLTKTFARNYVSPSFTAISRRTHVIIIGIVIVNILKKTKGDDVKIIFITFPSVLF